jgi:hypothetical protein
VSKLVRREGEDDHQRGAASVRPNKPNLPPKGEARRTHCMKMRGGVPSKHRVIKSSNHRAIEPLDPRTSEPSPTDPSEDERWRGRPGIPRWRHGPPELEHIRVLRQQLVQEGRGPAALGAKELAATEAGRTRGGKSFSV